MKSYIEGKDQNFRTELAKLIVCSTMKSTLFAAITISVLLCSILELSCARKVRPSAPTASPTTTNAPQQATTAPPTLLPHFYNNYATDRPTLKKLIDGTRAALFFLGQQNSTLWHGSLLPLVSNPAGVELQDYRDAIKAALDVFKIESSADTLDTALLTGVKSDICAWLSNEISGFICSENSLHQLSRTLEFYQTIRDTRDKLVAIDDGDEVTGSSYVSVHYRCAWANSHILGSCLNIPVPRSQDPKVVKLEHMFHCSILPPEGDYALCSNVA